MEDDVERPITRLIYLGLLFFAVALTVQSPVLPRIAASFHIGLSRLGVIFSCHFAGFCTALALTSLCSGRVPRYRLFTTGGIGMGVSLFSMACAPGIAAVYVAVFFIGGFGGLVESLGSAVLADLNPGRAGPVLNISQIFFAFGALAAPALAGALFRLGVSWRQVYAGIGLTTLVVLLPLAWMKPARAAEARLSRGSLTTMLGDPWFLGVMLVMAAYVGVEIGLFGWLSTFAERVLGFGPLPSSLAVSLFWVGVMLGRVACSRLTRSVSSTALLLGLFAAGTAATAGLIWLAKDEFSFFTLVFLAGLGFSGIWPTILAYGSTGYREHGTFVFSLIVASGGFGGIVVPALVGVAAEEWSLSGGLIILVGVELLAMVLVVFLRLLEYGRIGGSSRSAAGTMGSGMLGGEDGTAR